MVLPWYVHIHIQIPLTDNAGFIECSAAVATASWSSCEGMLQLLPQELSCHAGCRESTVYANLQ